jgi:hypothetical protein
MVGRVLKQILWYDAQQQRGSSAPVIDLSGCIVGIIE